MGMHRSLTVDPETPSRAAAAPRVSSLWAALFCVVVSGCFLPPPAEDKPLTDPLADSTAEPAVDSTVGSPAEAISDAAQLGSGSAAEDVLRVEVEPDSAPDLGSGSAPDSASIPGSISGSGGVASAPEGEAAPQEGGAVNPDGMVKEAALGADAGTDLALTGEGGPAGSQAATPDGSAPGSVVVPGSSGGDVLPDGSGVTGLGETVSDAKDTSVVEVQQSTVADLTRVADATDTVAPPSEDIDTQALERDPDATAPIVAPTEITPKELGSTVTDTAAEASDAASASSTGPPANGAASSVTPGAPTGGPGEAAAARVSDGFEVREYMTDDESVMTYEVGRPSNSAVPKAAAETGPINGATVVFIHGWCGNRAQWRGQMERFAPDSVVLSVDLLGHGESLGQPRSEWTIPRYGSDVAGVIEAEDLTDVFLVGHAMGGQVALEVALRIPDRIAGVIGVESLHELNVDTKGSLDAPELKEYLAGFEGNFMTAYEGIVVNGVHPSTQASIRDRISRDAEGCETPVAIKLMRHFQTRDLRGVVRSIECPVRCINSELFKTDVEGNRALLTGFAVEEMAGVGLWPHLEQPEAFHSALVVQINATQAPLRIPEESAMTGLLPVLFSDDVESLAGFYTKYLLFKEVGRQPSSLDEPATFIALERDDKQLQIQSRASLAIDVPGAEDVTQGGRMLFLTVTNLESERERLGTGFKMMVAFRILDTGSQQTVFRDPEKNVIVLQQPSRRVKTAQE